MLLNLTKYYLIIMDEFMGETEQNIDINTKKI